jgi:UDP-N-acetylmuramoyl-L-alanyl-D-glutamate--2,6-diaminopimelate ligase
MADKTLADLFAQYPFPVIGGIPDGTIISNIQSDSRRVKSGDLFVALKGHRYDGHEYIPQALTNGAVAIVGSKTESSSHVSRYRIPYIQVENSRAALAYLAAGFHDYPARKLTVIGVTGTDGKTTTCNLVYQILRNAGLKAGMISTVNAVIGDQVLDTGYHVTTPDAIDVQRYLGMMVNDGTTHVVLETTSHGWAQHRVDACEFDVGILTNITHEHLDEHGSFESYQAAKLRLFESLVVTAEKPQGNPRLAVLNRDDDSFTTIRPTITTGYKTYGLEPGADVTGVNLDLNPRGIVFDAVGQDWRVAVMSDLVGDFNVLNVLAAITAAVHGLGVDPIVASKGISKLKGIPGRMERIDLGQDFSVIVDFAHTPNALLRAIQTAREITTGRVIVIFGSAGLRDREKRRMMAEISGEMADYTVLTAEDPRTESLEEILSEMASGIESCGGRDGENFWRIPDRGEAIRFGLNLAGPGDLVMACGKGHEQSMCFGDVEYPWDDRIAIKAALSGILGIDGPKMPFLPTQEP